MSNPKPNQEQDFKIAQTGQFFNEVFEYFTPKKVLYTLLESITMTAQHVDDCGEEIHLLTELAKASVNVLEMDTAMKNQDVSTSGLDSILALDRKEVLHAVHKVLLKHVEHGDA